MNLYFIVFAIAIAISEALIEKWMGCKVYYDYDGYYEDEISRQEPVNLIRG